MARIKYCVPNLMAAVFLLSSLSFGDEPLTEDEAIRMAEKFVTDQGYTDRPARAGRPSTRVLGRQSGPESGGFGASRDTLVFESSEWMHDAGEVLRMRKGMLHREAVGAMRDGDGWIVGFRYAPDPEDAERGRRVEIDSRGGKIRLQREDVSLVPFRIMSRIARESSALGDQSVFSKHSTPEREKSD